MKPKYSIFSRVTRTLSPTLNASVMAIATSASISHAAVALTGASYTQNFDSIGSGLPTGWDVRTGASATTLGSAATLTTAATTWGDSGGAFKNVASSTSLTSAATTTDQANSSDRALGIRQTGSFGDPGAAFNFNFNSTGLAINTISFNLEMLSVQSRSSTWSIQYATSASPSSFTTLGTWGDPGTFGSTSLSFSTSDFGTNLNDLSSAWFRVVALSGSTSTGSRDTIAIDDFSMTFSALSFSDSYFWVGSDATRGGSGTWTNTGGTAWATSDADEAGGAWDASKTAIFNTAAATVSVSGTVDVNKGMTFDTGTNGSSITGGTAIALGGIIRSQLPLVLLLQSALC
jgi:hypothetical protein